MGFYHSREIYPTNMKKQIQILLLKKDLDALKSAFKKVFHNAAEETGEFKGNKIADKVVKPKPLPAENLRDNEKKYCPRKERRNIKRD